MSELMSRVFWAFGRQSYATYEEFVAAVTKDCQDVSQDHGWDPDTVVASGPVRIVFEAMWKDEDDELDLEVGERGVPLTMGRLLFELNQRTLDFWGDHPGFFEGLTPLSDETYRLSIGS